MYKSYNEIGVSEEKHQDQYAILELVDQEQKNKILSSHRVVLVDVFANWCGPCKQIAPSYSLLAMKYSKPTICALVKQQYDSVEEEIKNKIQGIPLFLYYINGELRDTVVGADLNEVENKLQVILSEVMNEVNLTREEKVKPNQPPPQYKSNIRSSKGTIPDFSNELNLYPSSPSPGPVNPYNQIRAPYPPSQNKYNSFQNEKVQNNLEQARYEHGQNLNTNDPIRNTQQHGTDKNPTYSVRYN